MFSRGCQYALRAVLYLAVHSEEAHPLNVRDIARALQVPTPYLSKLLQKLARDHLISSVKGPGGGYFMSPENLRSNLAGVIHCIDGPDALQGCIMGLPVCSSENPCPLHVQAYALREGLNYQLEKQTIGELAEKVKRTGLKL
ncbi:MAG: Rrf2 family transcriptional regulator [Bacteroidetes bacterium]|nr:MAG: Rrf2 family transcriptional regulator [Bacteroidota bacterium]